MMTRQVRWDWAQVRGSWALVTGASSGIGREFSIQLARRGMNLVLVARQGERLTRLSDELVRHHSIRCVAIPLDLSDRTSPPGLKERLDTQDIRIRLLVNNAGSGHWGEFLGSTPDELQRMITLNATAPVALCRLFAEDLEAATPSAVIHVSSPAAIQPMPYMAAYAASKAALHHFSLALNHEWRSRGILVQTLIPGPTESEFDARAGAYASALGDGRASASTVVARALQGLSDGSLIVSTAPGIFQQRLFAGVFPMAFVLKKVGDMFRPGK